MKLMEILEAKKFWSGLLWKFVRKSFGSEIFELLWKINIGRLNFVTKIKSDFFEVFYSGDSLVAIKNLLKGC